MKDRPAELKIAGRATEAGSLQECITSLCPECFKGRAAVIARITLEIAAARIFILKLISLISCRFQCKVLVLLLACTYLYK